MFFFALCFTIVVVVVLFFNTYWDTTRRVISWLFVIGCFAVFYSMASAILHAPR